MNALDGANNTPLIVAIDSGHDEIAIELIEEGASTIVDGRIRSPLHRAVEKNQKAVRWIFSSPSFCFPLSSSLCPNPPNYDCRLCAHF